MPEGELASIMPRSRQDRIVVFEIHQPSGQTHLVGMYIKGGRLKRDFSGKSRRTAAVAYGKS